MRSLKRIQFTWKEFVNKGVLHPDVDPIVANSWRRCSPRLNPHRQINPSKLTPAQLDSARNANQHLLAVARPIMEDIHQYIEGSNTLIVLVNSAGYALDFFGDSSMIEIAKRYSIEPGTSISEGQIGTNALALPLYDGVPAHTVGAEHYLKKLHGLAGAAAPIFTITGRTLGTLGILTRAENYHPHSLGLVVAGARAIEGQLQSIDLLEEQNIQLSELNTILASLSEGILVWNSEGMLMHANTATMNILGLTSGGLVGRPVDDNIRFPAFIQEALQKTEQLKDVEANIIVGERVVNCVINLDHVQKNQETRLVIMTLRPAEAVRKLVQKQVGAQAFFTLDDLVGRSREIRRIRRLVKAAAPAQAGILIRGESGTGKSVVATAIHHESPRNLAPFILVSCSSVPSEFILAELLGYESGTSKHLPGGRPSKFELAEGGTLYFQDVEHLPFEAQAALLNAIELGIVVRLGSAHPIPINVRIIASSSANLEKLIAEGSFRADLYYRLSSFEIVLPPLRARKADIPLLVERILERYNRQHERNVTLAAGTLNLLKKYTWPGNIRELETILARAMVQAGDSEIIGPMHFPEYIRDPVKRTMAGSFSPQVKSLSDLEREALIQAARDCNGNLTQMAKVLGIGRTTVWRKMKALNISPEQFRLRPKSPGT